MLRVLGWPQAFSPAQMKKLSDLTNVLTAIMQHKLMFTEKLKCLMSYLQAFEGVYDVHFIDLHIMETVKGRMCHIEWLPILAQAINATLELEG